VSGEHDLLLGSGCSPRQATRRGISRSSSKQSMGLWCSLGKRSTRSPSTARCLLQVSSLLAAVVSGGTPGDLPSNSSAWSRSACISATMLPGGSGRRSSGVSYDCDRKGLLEAADGGAAGPAAAGAGFLDDPWRRACLPATHSAHPIARRSNQPRREQPAEGLGRESEALHPRSLPRVFSNGDFSCGVSTEPRLHLAR